MDLDVKEILSRLVAGESLSREVARATFLELLAGRMEGAQIGAMLALIQRRGATVDELVGAGEAMRANVLVVERPPGNTAPVIDTCGTGGTPKTFNISTAAAIVAAAAANGRMLVAKHGNKSRSGRGSAEVLRELGVNIDAPPATQTECFAECGVCFCFSVNHHPAMKHAAAARVALGFPTMFNLLGPLTNPARAERQLMGVMGPQYVEPMARTLAALGSTRAMVVHSDDGMDEISISAPTRIAQVENGVVSLGVIDPISMGVARWDQKDLIVSTVPEAAAAIRDVLAGRRGARRDAVVVNAAAALLMGGLESAWEQALFSASVAIDSGRAATTLDRLREVSGRAG
ncbi:MAG: anthranilate phosphoribosyltransferase [Planctomycetota bacterium]